MHKTDEAQLWALIEKYGAALVAHEVMSTTFGPGEQEAKLQDAWMQLVDADPDFHDAIHSRPCAACGGLSGLGCGDTLASSHKQHVRVLCPGCYAIATK